MNKIYSALHLMRLNQLIRETLEMDANEFIEYTAQSFVNAFCQYYRAPKTLHIFAGYTDNGAIALAASRLLANRHFNIKVYLFLLPGPITDECRTQHIRSEQDGVNIVTITNQFSFPQISPNDLIIDGLFGSEATSSLEGGFIKLAQSINTQSCEIVSIDIPSGLLADDNNADNRAKAIQATRTITFDFPRIAMLMSENASNIGQWVIAQRGFDESIQQKMPSTYFYQSEQSLSKNLLSREVFTNKEDYGKALIIGGAIGRYGQLSLTAKASFLVGAGEVHIACPKNGHTTLSLASPESVLVYNDDNAQNIPSQLRTYKAIAIGTALSADSISEEQLRNIFSSYRHPIVLDSIAIDIISEHRSLLDIIPEGSILLLNSRQKKELLDLQFSDLEYIEAAKQLTSRRNLTIVLKGAYTAICRGSGNVYFNLKGNPGMASHGVGDVLTGLILGMLTRGYDTLTAVIISCYLHGSAGDYVAARTSEESLTASLLIEEIPEMLHLLLK